MARKVLDSIEIKQRNLRLADFLLSEAKIRMKKKENMTGDIVNPLIRQIGNHVVCQNPSGRCNSEYLKKYNKRISMKALDQMKKAKSFKDFHQKTINEHPRTVASIWQWIVDKRETLSPKQIVEYILEEPVTTVTKQEDDKLRKLGADAKKKNKDGYLSASERYKQAGIKITLLEQSPKGYYDNK